MATPTPPALAPPPALTPPPPLAPPTPEKKLAVPQLLRTRSFKDKMDPLVASPRLLALRTTCNSQAGKNLQVTFNHLNLFFFFYLFIHFFFSEFEFLITYKKIVIRIWIVTYFIDFLVFLSKFFLLNLNKLNQYLNDFIVFLLIF